MINRMSVIRRFLFATAVLSVLLAACASATPTAAPTEPPPTADEHDEHMDEHMDEDMDEHMDEHMHSPDDHMEGMHDVPESAAAVPNPVEATDESISIGADLYANSCAVCHGESGAGDGPAAAGLEVPPANLAEDHVQELTDGALFYILSHGIPDTPMPAWEEALDETERWHVVNFLRTIEG